MSKQILNQIPINLVDAVDKSVQLKDVKPQKLADGTWEVEITQPRAAISTQGLNFRLRGEAYTSPLS